MTKATVTEPYVVTDAFVSGHAKVQEPFPGILRAILVADQTSTYGEAERVVVAKIVGPRAVLRDLALAILQYGSTDTLDGETAESIAATCGTSRPQ